MSDAPARVVTRLYEAFESGDMATVSASFADTVVWHEGGIHGLAGEYHGLDGVLALNARAAELVGGSLEIEVHDVLGSDDHAVVLQRVTATKDGERRTLDEVLVVHVTRGRITEVWVAYPDVRTAVELFGT